MDANLPSSESKEFDLSYFGLQVYVGTTKHMGGLETTLELIRQCNVDGTEYVLEVGCGAGATSCYLAKELGCRVVGVDIRQGMVEGAIERARRMGVEDLVEFRVADTCELPFDDDQFDVLLCESVLTFVADKARALAEHARVVRPGGFVGLNEEFWLQPPPERIIEYAQRTWEIEPDILTVDDWIALLQGAGLSDVVTSVYRFSARREASQMKRYSARDMFKMFSRTLRLYLDGEFRAYMAERRGTPKDLFEYLGYALFVARA